MTEKDCFIGEYEPNLLNGHEFALKVDLRKHQNMSEEEKNHQHMYALFILLGSV